MSSSSYTSVFTSNAFIQHYIESLLEDFSLWELYFCVLTIRCIDYRLTADFSYFAGMAIECPAANLTATDYVFYKFNPRGETNGEFVKEFYVLEKIVIRITVERERERGGGRESKVRKNLKIKDHE